MTGYCVKVTQPGEQSWPTTHLESIAIASPGRLLIQHPSTDQGSIYSPRIWNSGVKVWHVIYKESESCTDIINQQLTCGPRALHLPIQLPPTELDNNHSLTFSLTHYCNHCIRYTVVRSIFYLSLAYPRPPPRLGRGRQWNWTRATASESTGWSDRTGVTTFKSTGWWPYNKASLY